MIRYGNVIENHQKNFFLDLKRCSLDPQKHDLVQERAKLAKYEVLKGAKLRRDVSRESIIRKKAKQYYVDMGRYLSWGFGEVFDEYFGLVNDQGQPHGVGIKFYSDGSIYHGPWVNGYQKTEYKGIMTRPDGSQYEGTWLQGRKHGFGRQIYADETVYSGQFANGFEHGIGKRSYKDGSFFEGRFRFGRRDGPGILVYPNGTIQKGVFRDALMNHEKPPPPVYESEKDILEPIGVLYHPLPLTEICLDQISYALINRPDLYPRDLLMRRPCEHLKPAIGVSYMKALGNVSNNYINAGKQIAFKSLDIVTHEQVRMKHADMEAFLYLQGANKVMNTLRLTTNRMESLAVESLGRLLPTNSWPNLQHLDLSFNSMDYRAISTLVDGILSMKKLIILKLAGCKINHSTSSLIKRMISEDTHLYELDLSFNMLGIHGAEDISNALEVNRTLVNLNLRSNNLGSTGGLAIVNSLKKNKTLKVLCLVDNNIGNHIATLLSGRLAGGLSSVYESFCIDELTIPERYLENNDHDA